VKNLVDLINNFNKSFKRPHQTVFGPPCPLVDSCVERPFHAINILDQTPLLSCSGVKLVCIFVMFNLFVTCFSFQFVQSNLMVYFPRIEMSLFL